MRYEKIFIGGLAFASFYILFWLWFFNIPKTQKNVIPVSGKQFFSKLIVNNNSILGAADIQPVLPPSYEISLESRQQSFNLSCEFAAASSIIFHFINNPEFAVGNEILAEKILIDKAWISKNPNVGIRMGLADVISLDSLYKNLNQWFGGSDYYGIHAPPFIDLFANYKLYSKPIYINDATISSIQKAISSDHLVMAWIKIGYAGNVDDDLLYGKVRIVRGEHSVVINGYDENGVVVMDPGTGQERHVDYSALIEASSLFPMPFLEVYKNTDNKASLENLTVGFDILTGIDRSIPKIYVRNGAGEVGVANQMRDILKDFGYSVNSVSNADNFDYQDVSIQIKKDFSDYLYILNRDIKLAGYVVASSSADLSSTSSPDAIVTVGR